MIFALIHRDSVIDVIEADTRPLRCALPGSYWVDVTRTEPTPTRGQRYDGFTFKEP